MERLCKELTDTYNTNVIDKQGNKLIAQEIMKLATHTICHLTCLSLLR